MPADVARTGSGGMAVAQPPASGTVGMAAGGDGAASEPATEPSHLLWPSKVFTTLSLCFEIQKPQIGVNRVINLAVCPKRDSPCPSDDQKLHSLGGAFFASS